MKECEDEDEVRLSGQVREDAAADDDDDVQHVQEAEEEGRQRPEAEEGKRNV